MPAMRFPLWFYGGFMAVNAAVSCICAKWFICESVQHLDVASRHVTINSVVHKNLLNSVTV